MGQWPQNRLHGLVDLGRRGAAAAPESPRLRGYVRADRTKGPGGVQRGRGYKRLPPLSSLHGKVRRSKS